MTIAQQQQLVRELSPQYLAVFGKKETDVSAGNATRQNAPTDDSTEPEYVICPNCNTYDMEKGQEVCDHCAEEEAEANPDGEWVNTPQGYIYE